MTPNNPVTSQSSTVFYVPAVDQNEYNRVLWYHSIVRHLFADEKKKNQNPWDLRLPITFYSGASPDFSSWEPVASVDVARPEGLKPIKAGGLGAAVGIQKMMPWRRSHNVEMQFFDQSCDPTANKLSTILKKKSLKTPLKIFEIYSYN